MIMSKDTKPVSTLGQAVLQTVVTALAESLTNAKNSASALIGFCNAAAKAKLAKTPDEADVVAIVDALSAKLGWNGTPREKVSKSEARNLVRQHAFLPELQTALRASEHGACSYHDAVKLSRLMKDHGNVSAAVAAFNTKAPKQESDTLKRFTAALQAHYQTVSEMKAGKAKTAMLSALAQCAEAFKIEAVK
jgi:hypothetical protein